MKPHDFQPTDRLRSRKSGRVWVYAIEGASLTPPEGFEDCIPVRDELWSTPSIVWFPPGMFEKVDDEYFDVAKAEDLT